MKTYVIFDLDGTLLNTIDDLAEATNYALRKLNFPVHGNWVYPTMVGNGVRKLIERALPDDARSERTINEALAAFKEYYGDLCFDKTVPYPGIPELLSDLTARGISLAVTSNKYTLEVLAQEHLVDFLSGLDGLDHGAYAEDIFVTFKHLYVDG